jgi:hypothetical protein
MTPPKTTEQRVTTLESQYDQVDARLHEQSAKMLINSLALIILMLDVLYLVWKLRPVLEGL